MRLIHLDSAGQTHMIGVTDKRPMKRTATVLATMICGPEILKRVISGEVPKNDVSVVTRTAGIAAAKRAPELLPLAHMTGVRGAAVDLTSDPESIEVAAVVYTADHTGVKMEALTTASVTALTLIDTVKDLNRHAHIHEVKLLAKEDDRSGSWRRDV